jgi:hypothetical protein
MLKPSDKPCLVSLDTIQQHVFSLLVLFSLILRGNSFVQCAHRKSINGALIHAYLHFTLGNIANISYWRMEEHCSWNLINLLLLISTLRIASQVRVGHQLIFYIPHLSLKALMKHLSSHTRDISEEYYPL